MYTQPDHVQVVLDRIARDTYTPDDVHWLQSVARVRGDGSAVQVGHYHIPLVQGGHIQIGDRYYRGADASAIRHVLADVVTTGEVSFGRHGPRVGKGSLRSFGGLVFTIGAIGLVVGIALIFIAFQPMMENPDAYTTGPSDGFVSAFVVAGVGMLVTWVGIIIRGWERPR